MANKVRVYGQSQKWTALGIVDAYVKMHPHATLKELQKVFPTSEINNTLDTVENILKADKSGSFDEKMSKQIGDMEMFITLEDGSQVAFTNPMWPADLPEAVGLGSSKLKNTDDPKAPENRRTEFVIIEE